MLRPVSEIIKELRLITQDLKEHNDRMDAKYGSTDVLPTSDARTRDAGSCPYKCEGDNE
jgi:hypothetical protein